jgi:hypothetical protein
MVSRLIPRLKTIGTAEIYLLLFIRGRARSEPTRNPDTFAAFAGFRVRAFGAPRNDRK